MNPLVLIVAGLTGLGATLVTYRNAQHRGVDRPVRWSAIVGLTFLLSPLLADELYAVAWLLFEEFFDPIYYHGAVLSTGCAVGVIAFLHYQLASTTQ